MAAWNRCWALDVLTEHGCKYVGVLWFSLCKSVYGICMLDRLWETAHWWSQKRTLPHKYTHVHISMRVHARMRTHVHTHEAHTHTRTHACTHPSPHIYICTRTCA